MTAMQIILGTLFLTICALLIVVVLLQKGRGGGLGAAFGGAGSSAFGTRTGDVFTWVTIVLVGLFLLLAIGSTLAFRPEPGTVIAPEFNPATGPVPYTVGVLITSDTRNARIAYTVDGSDPLEMNAKDMAPTVDVKPGQTLRARAFRAKWVDSDITSVTYDLKVKAPTTKPKPTPTTTTTTTPPDAPAATTQPK